MIDRLKVERSDEEQTRELGGTSCAFFMTDGHNSMASQAMSSMRSVNITELRNRLRRYLSFTKSAEATCDPLSQPFRGQVLLRFSA
jgi:hypothetical protein